MGVEYHYLVDLVKAVACLGGVPEVDMIVIEAAAGEHCLVIAVSVILSFAMWGTLRLVDTSRSKVRNLKSSRIDEEVANPCWLWKQSADTWYLDVRKKIQSRHDMVNEQEHDVVWKELNRPLRHLRS